MENFSSEKIRFTIHDEMSLPKQVRNEFSKRQQLSRSVCQEFNKSPEKYVNEIY